MEYCEGGSLYHMLDQAQYQYGLPEKQFLLVLFHVGQLMRADNLVTCLSHLYMLTYIWHASSSFLPPCDMFIVLPTFGVFTVWLTCDMFMMWSTCDMFMVWPTCDMFMMWPTCDMFTPKGGRGWLMSPSCLESQGCHLLPLSYLLSCFFFSPCLVLLLFLSCHFSANGPFSWLSSRKLSNICR